MPQIQNDFSYYRRTINKNRLVNQQIDEETQITGEIADCMSMFYAKSTPMLHTLSKATSDFVTKVITN